MPNTIKINNNKYYNCADIIIYSLFNIYFDKLQ
jgi:hypothetical protein